MSDNTNCKRIKAIITKTHCLFLLNKKHLVEDFLLSALVAIALVNFVSCSKKEKLFTSLSPEVTGIDFQNTINETDSFNILDYLYFYNGGGVAIGDINNDGLEDVYFTSNQGSNKLYLNKGNFHFEDITSKAGVAGKGNWKTGVTLADVNADGWLDIYVCEVGKYKLLQGRNELFINNHDGTFTEKAREYGLDVEGFNTQAAFFDYDKDGDLDMFLVNHSVHSTDTYVNASERNKKNEVSGDKLFRCELSSSTEGRRKEAFFTEVTEEAGIYSSIIGYGLNVVTGDFNNDNWEDIYVSNDFHENDYYYINNRNGTFAEINQQAFGHQSRFSMGSDAGDINNDGWLDLITLDMLPPDEKVLKSSTTDDALDIYDFKTGMGYHHQYSKNCLQLNTGGGRKFSDIGLYANVAATDWSWSPLLADFDNDGIKDIFVANGILRRPNDLDYLKFASNRFVAEDLQKGKAVDKIVLEQMPEGKIANYIFKGTPDLKFTDQSNSWGFDQPMFSNGAAYADLDNDGDLDLVVNNINATAGIYKNNATAQSKNNYLILHLRAKGNNKFSYGAKAVMKTREGLSINYVSATRGFESSSSPVLHFGLGNNKMVDTLQIIWPDGAIQNLINVKANQRLTIQQTTVESNTKSLLPDSSSFIPLFRNYTDSIHLEYKHTENNFIDFNVQPLIPHEVSTQGPKLAVADINGDGLDDFFVCGARGQAGKLFQQTKEGKFISTNETVLFEDAASEDVNAVFFDADNDKDNDLYVVSGGNEVTGYDPFLLDRLYLNDGKGKFSKASLPPMFENKSVAVPSDVDHDGDMDLFVGGRVVAKEYGKIPLSFLLLNNGKAEFSIAPDNICPGLKNIGMVTGAVWNDIDRDGWSDLIIAGEWMPITVYKNEKGRLRNATDAFGLTHTTGLWTTIISADINNDGYEDFLAGNWGRNSKLQASEKFPLQMYVGDIDGNGAIEQILCIAKEGAYYPFSGKEEIEKLIPGVIRKKFLDYKTMAGKTVEEVFENKLSGLKKFSVNTLSSLMITNDRGKLSVADLPASVQWSPVFSFSVNDFNKDGKMDILAAGNFYGVLPYEGRYDASYGVVLCNKGNFFEEPPAWKSGLLCEGEIRDIKQLKTVKGNLLLFSRNNNTIQVYKN